MNQGPTESLVLVKNKGTQRLNFESNKLKTNLISNTSLKNTFVQDNFRTLERKKCMDLNNLFIEIY
jgi:hypothetical protein